MEHGVNFLKHGGKGDSILKKSQNERTLRECAKNRSHAIFLI